ncbi:short-chain dehydrogenase [Virgisporangium aliadipatigenens]|uniref:Short-chain dehydrogenase n=1 Tax=Virgisporangium aliadipatigenens TaxID=741659 RepID=A0A8J4DUE7_9ACTN|nr:SDR family NAD(P)-dependent oxidoreductase [Virgisporangium aliadipatigenens]GIJ51235.1 short-chain dehydrogenase [Virgisporangium aliadipatigenens]
MSLRRPLSESVVVLTGASGGIGAATAEALARHGTAVVLAGRGPDALAEVAQRCRAAGGRALDVPTEITDRAAVAALADKAESRYGRIDAWINNASVGLYAALEDAPVEQVRRTIEVNVFGYLHGVQEALPRMRATGGGVLVNVASVLGAVTTPFMGAYNLSKHAVRALSDTLRQEIGDEPVSVCTVLPASIDTPFYPNAANVTGRTPRPIPPVYRPETVATTIVRVLRRPRREAYAGALGHAMAIGQRIAPGLTERGMGWYGARAAFSPGRAPVSTGNLYRPSALLLGGLAAAVAYRRITR